MNINCGPFVNTPEECLKDYRNIFIIIRSKRKKSYWHSVSQKKLFPQYLVQSPYKSYDSSTDHNAKLINSYPQPLHKHAKCKLSYQCICIQKHTLLELC